METKQRCPKCDSQHGHSIHCPDIPIEKKAEMAVVFHDEWVKTNQRYHDYRMKHHEKLTFWQGKFRAVKHENNQLRNKLYAKSKPSPDDTTNSKTI